MKKLTIKNVMLWYADEDAIPGSAKIPEEKFDKKKDYERSDGLTNFRGRHIAKHIFCETEDDKDGHTTSVTYWYDCTDKEFLKEFLVEEELLNDSDFIESFGKIVLDD